MFSFSNTDLALVSTPVHRNMASTNSQIWILEPLFPSLPQQFKSLVPPHSRNTSAIHSSQQFKQHPTPQHLHRYSHKQSARNPPLLHDLKLHQTFTQTRLPLHRSNNPSAIVVSSHTPGTRGSRSPSSFELAALTSHRRKTVELPHTSTKKTPCFQTFARFLLYSSPTRPPPLIFSDPRIRPNSKTRT